MFFIRFWYPKVGTKRTRVSGHERLGTDSGYPNVRAVRTWFLWFQKKVPGGLAHESDRDLIGVHFFISRQVIYCFGMFLGSNGIVCLFALATFSHRMQEEQLVTYAKRAAYSVLAPMGVLFELGSAGQKRRAGAVCG